MYTCISRLLLLLVLSDTAYANTMEDLYVGFGSTLNNLSDVGGKSSNANSQSSGTRLYIGHRINARVAIEGGYTSSAEQSEGRKMDAGATQTSSKRIEIIDLSFLIKTEDGTPDLRMRAGIAIVSTHTKNTENDTYMNNNNSTSTTTYGSGVIGGVTYEYPLSESLFVNAGYVRYISLMTNMDQSMGTADFSGNLFSVSIKKQF